MIQFETCKLKNFLSVGDNPLVLQLNRSPTTLITGKNGVGKCLDPSTEITIEFDDSDEFLKNYFTHTKGTTTLGQLVSLLQTNPEYRNRIKVSTRFGFKPVVAGAITAKDSLVYKIITTCGKTLKTSPDHLMLSTDCVWVKTKDLSSGDFLFTPDGPTRIKSVRLLKTKMDLYDIQVDEVKEFYANGLVSHNSSIVADALTFSLFGKSFRGINKPSLINTINQKDSVVELTFTKGSDQFVIIRGQKPSRLEITKNGSKLDEDAAVKDTQEYIEKEVLGFDYNSFIRVCILSTMNYTPFMQLSTFERRNLVETMLSLKAFSDMNKIHKGRLSVIKDSIQQMQSELSIKKTSYDEKRNTLDLLLQLDEDRISKIKKEANETLEKIEVVDKAIADCLVEKERLQSLELDQTRLDLKSAIQQILSEISARNGDILNRTKKISYLKDHSVCDKCDSLITEEHRSDCVSQEERTISSQKDEVVTLKTTLQMQEAKLKDVDNNIQLQRDLNSRIESAMSQKKILKEDLRRKVSDITDKSSSDTSSIKEQIAVLKSDIKRIAEKYQELNVEKDTSIIVADLLKDTGIKSSIIKQYIPLLVGYVNHYLEKLNVSIRFSMDENFVETITTRYANEYSYTNLSMGERARVDLAMAFAWRKIAKMKGSVHTNLLVLDEILDASLDTNGTEDAMTILEEVCQDEHVFIISHKNNLDEKVRSVIRLEKVNGFTKITI